MVSVTVYGIKQGAKWLTKATRADGGSYRLLFQGLSDARYLNGVEAQARKVAAERGGVVVPVVFTGQ